MRAGLVERPAPLLAKRRADRAARAIVAAFPATAAMLFTFLVAYNGARVVSAALPADAPGGGILHLWLHNLTHNQLIDAGRADVFVAAAIYLLGGLGWAVVYALLAEPYLPGPGWARGAAFSIVPAVLSVVVFLPLVGGGMLGSALGAGPLPAIGNLVLHVAYGVILGHLYGPFGDLDADTLRRGVDADSAARRSLDLVMARGILIGLVVGLGLGLAGVLMVGAGFNGMLFGQPVAALLFSSAAVGAALGIWVGSLLGLAARSDASRTR